MHLPTTAKASYRDTFETSCIYQNNEEKGKLYRNSAAWKSLQDDFFKSFIQVVTITMMWELGDCCWLGLTVLAQARAGRQFKLTGLNTELYLCYFKLGVDVKKYI